ncbi:MAG: hypothetical protein JSS34_06425 [Proteobacteria bacterium]|nr:hypothetical protein [Pseudomonadota bacterium]
MVRNLKRTFKDVLKIISLGVMASINGMSGDAFAMGDDFDEGLPPRSTLQAIREAQGDMKPEDALAAALAASIEGIQFGDYRDDFSSGRGVDFQAAAARTQGRDDDLQRALDASRKSYLEQYGQDDVLRRVLEMSAHEAAFGAGQEAAAAEDDDAQYFGLPAGYAAAEYFNQRGPADFDDEAAGAADEYGAAGAADEYGAAGANGFGEEDPADYAPAAPARPAAEPQIEFSQLPVTTWTAAEINGENFTREVSRHIALAYESLKSKTVYGQIEKLRAERDDWAGLQGDRPEQDIQGEINRISQEIRDLEQVMVSEPTLEAWTQSVLGEVGRLVRTKNKGLGVGQNIQEMITDLLQA